MALPALVWGAIAVAGAVTAHSTARVVEAVTDDPDQPTPSTWPAVALASLAVALAVWGLMRR